MICAIPNCSNPVAGPLRVCAPHYKCIPRPQAEALSFYARKNKRGPAHRAAFERAVESVTKLIEARQRSLGPVRAGWLPYRDD